MRAHTARLERGTQGALRLIGQLTNRMVVLEITALDLILEAKYVQEVQGQYLSHHTQHIQQSYETFLLWRLATAGIDDATARLLLVDTDNDQWSTIQADLRECMGVGHYEKVRKLFDAGARRLHKLRSYLAMTDCNEVKSPSQYILL
jgi:hypothetical protein